MDILSIVLLLVGHFALLRATFGSVIEADINPRALENSWFIVPMRTSSLAGSALEKLPLSSCRTSETFAILDVFMNCGLCCDATFSA